MKNVKVSVLLKALADDGWEMVKQKGSHRQFKHPDKPGKVTVNGGLSDDICGIALRSIQKQSGLTF
ncbi:MAG: type II toxin-antitoxin system HicA family toxin [Tannerellaceae bacterium]|nr:type II toxin-antitoxin system HicA family toxin [Tannerellaceae bacterium]